MTTEATSRINHEALRVYLRDHHAGAVAGRALAQHISSRSEGTVLETETAALAADIAADMQTLEAVMAALEIATSTVKDVVAAAGERFMRLKPNGDLFGSSPLSLVVELETLSSGIAGKAALWQSLQTISAAEPRLAQFDFAAFASSAQEQRERVAACHNSVVPSAFKEAA